MSARCPSCGNEESVGKFCPVCGSAVEAAAPADPLIGTIIAERFRVVERLSEGGMGRVYAGTQVALDRPVAISFIHGHLATSDEIAQRFMAEARALSRVAHPNVVQIYDFGSTKDGQLFMVMELLKGRELAEIIQSGEPMPIERVGDIIEQVLTGLAEAHAEGIVHRDIKSENVFLEKTRSGRDRVKLIDFGIAKAGGKKLTQAGQIAGTPQYIAPEVIRGGIAGPAADLYAVGVLLFELLTGIVPFDADDPMATLQLHLNADRPDPRQVAPDRAIADSVAEVCLKAMQMEPENRFTNADDFTKALNDAIRGIDDDRNVVLPPAPPSGAPPSLEESHPEDAPLLERAPWAIDLLGANGAMLVWGESGAGRTWLLERACEAFERRKAHVIRVLAEPPPMGELGYRGMRRILAALTGAEPDTPPRSISSLSDPRAVQGVRNIYSPDPPKTTKFDPQEAAVAALDWAISHAVEAAEGRRVVLAIDDVDLLDNVSAFPLADAALRRERKGFLLLMTSRTAPSGEYRQMLEHRELRGFERARAAERVDDANLPPGDEVLPLYVEHVERWTASGVSGDPPSTLDGIVEARLRRLRKSSLRTLVAIAVAGSTPIADLRRLLARPEDVDDSLRPLTDGGFIVVDAGTVQPTHALYSALTLAIAPEDALRHAHQTVADLLSEHVGGIELQAYHSIRSDPGFQSFMLVEQAARLRVSRGDVDGAMTMLRSGLDAASDLHEAGDEFAQSARVVFGRKIAGLLVDVGQDSSAAPIIEEITEFATDDADRAQLLELRSAVARQHSDAGEAERLHGEALRLARRTGDANLLARIERVDAPRTTGFIRRPSSIVPRHTPAEATRLSSPRLETLKDEPTATGSGSS